MALARLARQGIRVSTKPAPKLVISATRTHYRLTCLLWAKVGFGSHSVSIFIIRTYDAGPCHVVAAVNMAPKTGTTDRHSMIAQKTDRRTWMKPVQSSLTGC
jgi:hypothetical protein